MFLLRFSAELRIVISCVSYGNDSNFYSSKNGITMDIWLVIGVYHTTIHTVFVNNLSMQNMFLDIDRIVLWL